MPTGAESRSVQGGRSGSRPRSDRGDGYAAAGTGGCTAGNVPQALTHLSHIAAACALERTRDPWEREEPAAQAER